MNEMSLVKKHLEKLKLSGILNSVDERVQQAMAEKWSYSSFLEALLLDEVDKRNRRQLLSRLAKSHLDPSKTLETLNFSFNTELAIQAALIRELAMCNFLEKSENIFILGLTGVGKSHLAQALGHEACRRGWDVLFYRTHLLLDWVYSGKGDGTYKKRLQQIIKVPLLILDDFGLQALEEARQGDLYEIICERYEKRSLIITSNRALDEWGRVFNNPLLGAAALDRLVHKGLQIAIEGKSHRLEEFQKRDAAIKEKWSKQPPNASK